MQYYVERFRITVTVIDGMIDDITRGKVSPDATVVDSLDASLGRIYVADGRLYLDGFALTDFMAWLWHERPSTSPKAFGHRLENYFPGSNINDVLFAISHVVLGMEHRVNGERQHFAAKVRDAHPDEFAELRTAMQWALAKQRLNPDGPT